ncbi:MAG: hypothetical protein PS018_23260 [bacterium]|nr:hypothetical protein [bacterium]
MRKRTISLAFAAVAAVLTSSLAVAQNLAPSYQPRPQTDNERLQNFKAPPPPPTSYPNISRDSGTNEPRLNVNRDVSLGGNVTRDSMEGNVRFPIPGKR